MLHITTNDSQFWHDWSVRVETRAIARSIPRDYTANSGQFLSRHVTTSDTSMYWPRVIRS